MAENVGPDPKTTFIIPHAFQAWLHPVQFILRLMSIFRI